MKSLISSWTIATRTSRWANFSLWMGIQYMVRALGAYLSPSFTAISQCSPRDILPFPSKVYHHSNRWMENFHVAILEDSLYEYWGKHHFLFALAVESPILRRNSLHIFSWQIWRFGVALPERKKNVLRMYDIQFLGPLCESLQIIERITGQQANPFLSHVLNRSHSQPRAPSIGVDVGNRQMIARGVS